MQDVLVVYMILECIWMNICVWWYFTYMMN